MQAIIPSSGRGERMMPLTDNTPKSLIEVAGKPMMEYTIDLLASHGITDIGVSLFYLGDQVQDYFDDGSRFGVKITYARESKLTGTAGAVKAVAQILKPEAPIFVIAPDILNNFDLTSIFKFHQSHGGIATITCYWRTVEAILGKSGVVVFDQESKLVTDFVERPEKEEDVPSQWVSSSIYIFSPDILEFIPDEIDGSKIIDFPKHIFPAILSSKNRMYAYPVDKDHFYQLGLDSPDMITRAEKDIEDKVFIPTNNS